MSFILTSKVTIMSQRIAPPAPDNSPEHADVWETFSQFYDGRPPNSMLTMAHVPGLVSAFADLAKACIRRPGNIPADHKWLIANIASRAAGCRYCTAHTLHNGSKNGVDAERLDAIWEFETSPLFTEAQKASFRLALAVGSNSVTDDEVKAAKQHYSDQEMAEIVAVIAMFGFLNRWNDAVGTTLESSALTFAADKNLQARGWQVGPHASD
ncbi:MAG: carboxymuconolactone decarboxylase family protein [Pseudolabrys sp.]|nr:carboxymuconolactone decarboxylase family protein [Pseudolabrys sp.]